MASDNKILSAAVAGSKISLVAAAYIILGASIYQKIEGLSVIDSYY